LGGDKAVQASNLSVGAIVGIVVAGVTVLGVAAAFIGLKLKKTDNFRSWIDTAPPSDSYKYNSM